MSEEFGRTLYTFATTLLQGVHNRETYYARGELSWIVRNRIPLEQMMHNDDTTCRYYADHAGWRVDMMDGGRSPPLRGELGEYPDWLAVILDVARIGGHIAVWAGPDKRPTQTMWFRIDKQHQLVEFVDWMK